MKMIILFVLSVLIALACIYAGGSLLLKCYDENTTRSEQAGK
jgi:hypothetical protein